MSGTKTARPRTILVVTAAFMFVIVGVVTLFAQNSGEPTFHDVIPSALNTLQPTFIDSLDPRILYIGRFTNGKQFSWPGSQLYFRVNGTGASLIVNPAVTREDRFQVLVDGKPHGQPFQLKQNATSEVRKTLTHVLAADLPDGEHTIGIWKLTEAGYPLASALGGWEAGASIIEGILLPKGTMLAAPPRPARHLRFVGDSDTVAYCADGQPNVDGKVVGSSGDDVENNYVGWSAQIARSFDAVYTAQAISGIGLMDHKKQDLVGPTNINALLEVDATAGGLAVFSSMNFWMDNTNAFNPIQKWNVADPATDSVPDAVISLIGPNDYNNELMPDGSVYERRNTSDFHTAFQKYLFTFLTKHAETYSEVPKVPKVIMVCGGSGDEGFDPCNQIKADLAVWNHGVMKSPKPENEMGPIAYVSVGRATWRYINLSPKTSDFKGCVKHYNPRGHTIVARELAPQIGQLLDWDHSPPYDWCETDKGCSDWCADPTNKCGA